MRNHLIDVSLALAVGGLLVYSGVEGIRHPPLWPVAVGVVVVSLLLRRRFPLIASLATTTATLFTPLTLFAPFFTIYTVAAQRGPKWPTWVSVVALLAVLLGFVRPDDAEGWMVIGVWVVLTVIVPVLAGLWMYQRAVLLDALRDRADQAERERDLLAERAVTAERRRIAREMHDVVAHRVSIVALQAGALSVRAPDEATGQLAEVIRESSSAALNELRDILQVLREEGTEPRALPAPALSGVRQLTEDLSAAGSRVRAELPDPLPQVPDPVGRAAYRIVQEALTNAAKHAPGTPIDVRLGSAGEGLVVEVANPLAGSSGLPGAGYGVIGMRERVTLAGGSLRAGPDGAGNYRVRAVFPPGGDTQC
ncbi:sensor histidine kinase [Amycolatopsis jiangsuensis]|uniref:histidine kinase n=1 Tax=Amycolatopsis jiangsuensis TaxID=1181879 RepID=A0A840J6E1_9PSEU|nr:histidine kinase [Amycolatopsis jiangsuensis]MBB4689353.1 signal transduction histidine kinase [Amycolatopsis jiangsuensis]